MNFSGHLHPSSVRAVARLWKDSGFWHSISLLTFPNDLQHLSADILQMYIYRLPQELRCSLLWQVQSFWFIPIVEVRCLAQIQPKFSAELLRAASPLS